MDLTLGLLSVRRTKFAKSRELPLHPSTVEALARYRDLRHRFVRLTAEMPFFWLKKFARKRETLGISYPKSTSPDSSYVLILYSGVIS